MRITQMDVRISLDQPVQEVTEMLNFMLGCHPGQELVILRALDEQIGITLAKAEMKQQDPEGEKAPAAEEGEQGKAPKKK